MISFYLFEALLKTCFQDTSNNTNLYSLNKAIRDRIVIYKTYSRYRKVRIKGIFRGNVLERQLWLRLR